MLDLEQPIVPGCSAAGVSVGDTFVEVAVRLGMPRIEPPCIRSRYSFGPVTLWVKGGRVSQIGVGRGYVGKVQGIVGIGSTLSEVQAAFGEVIENDEDNLIVPSVRGWSFETTEWSKPETVHENLDSTICEIYVFSLQP